MHGVVIACAMREIGDVCSVIAMVPGYRIASCYPLRKWWLCHRPQSLTGLTLALAKAAPDVKTCRNKRRPGGDFVCPAAQFICRTGASLHWAHARADACRLTGSARRDQIWSACRSAVRSKWLGIFRTNRRAATIHVNEIFHPDLCTWIATSWSSLAGFLRNSEINRLRITSRAGLKSIRLRP